ncbi:hypothetical protein WDW89_09230, partial [Deltaproteobacteria bacterium TL4]
MGKTKQDIINDLTQLDTLPKFWDYIKQRSTEEIQILIDTIKSDDIDNIVDTLEKKIVQNPEINQLIQGIEFIQSLSSPTIPNGKTLKTELLKTPDFLIDCVSSFASKAALDVLIQNWPPEATQAINMVQTLHTFTVDIKDWSTFNNAISQSVNGQMEQFNNMNFWEVISTVEDLAPFLKERLGGAENHTLGKIINGISLLSDIERFPQVVTDLDSLKATVEELPKELYDSLKGEVVGMVSGQWGQSKGTAVIQMFEDVRNKRITSWDAFLIKHGSVFLDDTMQTDLQKAKEALLLPILMRDMLQNPQEGSKQLLVELLKTHYELKNLTIDDFKDAQGISSVLGEIVVTEYLKKHVPVGKINQVIDTLKSLSKNDYADAELRTANLLKDITLEQLVSQVPGLGQWSRVIQGIKEGDYEKVVLGAAETLFTLSIPPLGETILSLGYDLVKKPVGDWITQTRDLFSGVRDVKLALFPKDLHDTYFNITDATQNNLVNDDLKIEYSGSVEKISVLNPANGQILHVGETSIEIQSQIDGTIHVISGLDSTFMKMMKPVFDANKDKTLSAGTLLGYTSLVDNQGTTTGEFHYQIKKGAKAEFGHQNDWINVSQYWEQGGPLKESQSWNEAQGVLCGNELIQGEKQFFEKGTLLGRSELTIESPKIFAQPIYNLVHGKVIEYDPTAGVVVIEDLQGVYHRYFGLKLDEQYLKANEEINPGNQIGWLSPGMTTVYYEVLIGNRFGGDYADVRVDANDFWNHGGIIEVDFVAIDPQNTHLEEGEETLYVARLNVDIDDTIEVTIQSDGQVTLDGKNSVRVSFHPNSQDQDYTDSEGVFVNSLSVGGLSAATSSITLTIGQNIEKESLKIYDTEGGLYSTAQNSLGNSWSALKDLIQSGELTDNVLKTDSLGLIQKLNTFLKELKQGLTATLDQVGYEMIYQQWIPLANEIDTLEKALLIEKNDPDRNWIAEEQLKFTRIDQGLTSTYWNIHQLFERLETHFSQGEEINQEQLTPIVIQVEQTLDVTELELESLQDTIREPDASKTQVSLQGDSIWEKVTHHLLHPSNDRTVHAEVLRDFHAPTVDNQLFAATTLCYNKKFSGKSNVYSPVTGVIQQIAEGSVWVALQDGSVHRFSNLDEVPISTFKTGDIINTGSVLGSITSQGSVQYSIYALGDPTADVSTWPKFNPEEYWERGGLGLEVVTATSTEGIAIEEGSQEQLTFRLKVGHTGEIKLKLRFNYEGTAE